MTSVHDDLAALGDRALRSRIRRERKNVRKLEDGPATQEVVDAMQASVDAIKAAEKELRIRALRTWEQAQPSLRAMRREAEERAAQKEEHAAAWEALRLTSGPGAKTDATRLTRQEGEELLRIARKLYAEGLTEGEEARRQKLVCIAADDPDVFERHERERTLVEKQAALAEKERLASLPRRGTLPPGSVVVPGELAQELLEARDDGMTSERLGTLLGVLLGIEGHLGTLVGSRYEEGALVGASQPYRFFGPDGGSAVSRDLHYLQLTGWLVLDGGIRLGPRMQTFLSTLEGGETSG